MIHRSISLTYQDNEAFLDLYCIEKNTTYAMQIRPTVLIFPGGGYGALSIREGESIALRFLGLGYQAAVLRYGIKEKARFPEPLCQAAMAMAYLRENAEELAIDTTRLYTIGFSAGGHLALTLGVYWHEPWLAEAIGKPTELLAPTAQILAYPVVLAGENAHTGSIERASGGDFSKESLDRLSLEKHVSEHTPPTFLWTTYTDKTVPCENSLELICALRRAGVNSEFHLYGWGPHGGSLFEASTQSALRAGCDPDGPNQISDHMASWFPLCTRWLDHFFGYEQTKA